MFSSRKLTSLPGTASCATPGLSRFQREPLMSSVAVAAIEQAAIQASCETRLLVGQQAQAFTAAALPLCRAV